MEEEERATSTFSEVDVLLLTSTMPSDRLQLYALAGSDTHDLASLDPHSLGKSFFILLLFGSFSLISFPISQSRHRIYNSCSQENGI